MRYGPILYILSSAFETTPQIVMVSIQLVYLFLTDKLFLSVSQLFSLCTELRHNLIQVTGYHGSDVFQLFAHWSICTIDIILSTHIILTKGKEHPRLAREKQYPTWRTRIAIYQLKKGTHWASDIPESY